MPNDEPMAEASSSQSDSEESDGGEIDISEQDASAIMTAEAALESNPYDYEGHANVSTCLAVLKMGAQEGNAE